MNTRRDSKKKAHHLIDLDGGASRKPTKLGIRALPALGLAVCLVVAPAVNSGAATQTATSSAPESAEETFVFLTGEEKLARDVYKALGAQYNVRQFDRIAASEARHLAAMRAVLASLGYPDPTAGDGRGEFDDPQLQKLYDDYVAKGSTGIAQAAAVGIAIEKADIAELTSALADSPDNQTTKVLQSQIEASQRHLAAFERLASRQTGRQAGAQSGQRSRGRAGQQSRARDGGAGKCTGSSAGGAIRGGRN